MPLLRKASQITCPSKNLFFFNIQKNGIFVNGLRKICFSFVNHVLLQFTKKYLGWSEAPQNSNKQMKSASDEIFAMLFCLFLFYKDLLMKKIK